MYGTEQDQINDKTDPLKKRELEKNRKYPTAYYHMIYNTTGMGGINAIELNYNWVVDFLTICPSTEKKMDLLTGPSSVTVYDATGRPIMEGTEEKKEKVWWYDRGTASVCSRIFSISDFSNSSFDPSQLQGALTRRTNGKGFVAEMSKADACCSFSATDLGIAIGSAVALAADNRIDNRVMYSIGRSALRLKLFADNVKLCYGIPLSTGAKSNYFDRAPGSVLL